MEKKEEIKKLKRRRIRKIIKIIVNFVIIGILLYLVFLRVNPGKLFSSIKEIKIGYLLLAFVVYFVLGLVLSYRVWRGFLWVGEKLGFWHCYFVNELGLLVSNFTPSKSGFSVMAYPFYKKDGIPIRKTMSVLFSFLPFELFFGKGLGILFGLIYLIYKFGNGLFLRDALVAFFVLFLVSLGLFFWLFFEFSVKIGKVIYKIPFIGRKLLELLLLLKEESHKLRGGFWILGGVSFLGWILRGVEWMFIGWAVGISLPFLVFLALHPIVTSARLVPFVPGGFGVFEGAVIFTFSYFGFGAEQALLFAFLDRIDNIIIDLVGLREARI